MESFRIHTSPRDVARRILFFTALRRQAGGVERERERRCRSSGLDSNPAVDEADASLLHGRPFARDKTCDPPAAHERSSSALGLLSLRWFKKTNGMEA